MLLLILVSSFLVAAFLPLIFWFLNLRKYSYVENIPGPPLVPVFGNIFELGSGIVDFLANLTRLTKEYGPIVRIWQGPFRLSVIITDPKYVEFFLGSNVHITKSSGYDLLKPWLGNGLINSTGNHWRRHRKIITPTFHFKILEQFTEVFNSTGNILIDKLTHEVNKSSVDIYPFVNMYALDVICETSMGIKVNAQLNENREYTGAVGEFLELFMIKFFSIMKRFPWYYRFTPNYSREQKTLTILNNLTRTVIENRKRERQENLDATDEVNEFGIKKKQALLDVMLNLQNNDALIDEELKEEVNTFLFAGHDTISTALSFSLFQAAKYPEMQSIMFDEIISVVGKNRNEPITMQHAQELKYLERFLKEVFRMYPPVPFYERTIEMDVKLDNFKLPKGTNITILPFAMHNCEKYFPNPEKFDPDRFLPENSAKTHNYAYVPFNAGPRNCIGQRFAMLQMKTTFANILRSLELLPVVPEHKFVLGNDAVLKAMNGIPIRIKIRE